MKQFIPILLIIFLLAGCGSCNVEIPNERLSVDEPTQDIEPVYEQTEEKPTPADKPEEEPISFREPCDEDFVRIADYIPEIIVDLKYSTDANFTGEIIYNFTDGWLRYGTVKKLIAVQDELKASGYCLKIWDAFRPTEAQFRLWDVYPDPTYVANPNKGFSSHSRGNTVDLTIVRLSGGDVNMPSAFDDFTKAADRDYSDCTEESRENALLLENTMVEHGFTPYRGEWWHFSDTDSYPVEKSFSPS